MEIDDEVTFEEPAVAQTDDRNALVITTSVSQIQSALSEMDKIAASLPGLAEAHPVNLVFDVTTPKGMAEAIAHRAAWRDPRIAVEKYRKTAKSPVLTLGKAIDARAAWLTERLEAGEIPVHEQIKAEEARKAQERADREAKEFGRVVAMQEAIEGIAMAAMVSGKSSTEIAARLDAMKSTELDIAIYQEMMPRAQEARVSAIGKLEQALKAAQWDEAEAKKRADEAERLRIQRAAEDAERLRVAAEQRAEAARLAEEKAQMAAERAEIARQRAELEASKPAPAAPGLTVEPPIPAPTAAPVQPPEPERPLYHPLTAEVTVPPALREEPTLSLGDIKERLSPLSITADGMAQLGFVCAATKGPTRLYMESDWPKMKLALVKHIEGLA